MSPHILQGWQDRYIKLEDMQLSWSVKQVVKGQINFDLVDFKLEQESSNK